MVVVHQPGGEHRSGSGPHAVAALSVMESLLLELLSLGLLDRDRVSALLEDAACAHELASLEDESPADAAAARLIRSLATSLLGAGVGEA